MLDQEQFDVVIIDLFSLDFDGRAVAKHFSLTKSLGSTIVIGLSERPALMDNDEFDRIFPSPLSARDLAEIFYLCTQTNNFDMNIQEPVKHNLAGDRV